MKPSKAFQLHLTPGKTWIQGILNVTPDSFSDGGHFFAVEAAVAHARQLASEGADWIDIGGESTRPGADPVSLTEELKRVIPVVLAVREALPDLPISIDTYKAEVARQALEAGADIINDVWMMQKDPQMIHVVRESGAPVILNHNRMEPMPEDVPVEQVVMEDLMRVVTQALHAGIRREQLILDPGIGFGFKTTADNLRLMAHLDRLTVLGYPVLLGTSRKKFIRETLGRGPMDVLEGTAATVAWGIAKGCSIVRVHDVAEIRQVVTMCDAIRSVR